MGLDRFLLRTSLEVIGESGALDRSLLIALTLLPAPESIVVTADHVFFGGGFSTEFQNNFFCLTGHLFNMAVIFLHSM